MVFHSSLWFVVLLFRFLFIYLRFKLWLIHLWNWYAMCFWMCVFWLSISCTSMNIPKIFVSWWYTHIEAIYCISIQIFIGFSIVVVVAVVCFSFKLFLVWSKINVPTTFFSCQRGVSNKLVSTNLRIFI